MHTRTGGVRQGVLIQRCRSTSERLSVPVWVLMHRLGVWGVERGKVGGRVEKEEENCTVGGRGVLVLVVGGVGGVGRKRRGNVCGVANEESLEESGGWGG